MVKISLHTCATNIWHPCKFVTTVAIGRVKCKVSIGAWDRIDGIALGRKVIVTIRIKDGNNIESTCGWGWNPNLGTLIIHIQASIVLSLWGIGT